MLFRDILNDEFGIKTIILLLGDYANFKNISEAIRKRCILDDSCAPRDELIGYCIHKFKLTKFVKDKDIPTLTVPEVKADVEWLFEPKFDRNQKKQVMKDFFKLTSSDAAHYMNALRLDKVTSTGNGVFNLPPIYQMKFQQMYNEIYKLKKDYKELLLAHLRANKDVRKYKNRCQLLANENKVLKRMLLEYTTQDASIE